MSSWLKELHEKRFTITKKPTIHKGQGITKRLERRVQDRPATFAHFSVGQMVRIFDEIQSNPFKERYAFHFGRDTFIVTLHAKESWDTVEQEAADS